MNHFDAQPKMAALSAVKQSPVDERLASLGGSIASLESEVEALLKQLDPVMVKAHSESGNANAPPSPVESAVEQALRGYDYRVDLLWKTVSALRAQLRV